MGPRAVLCIALLLCPSTHIVPRFLTAAHDVKVGLMYYTWYEGENGTRHWNGMKGWTVVDEPLLGWYNSSDDATIRQHLDWMRYAGIDFVILSWWGPENVWNTDRACRKFFEVASTYASDLKIAIMVEAFNETAGPDGYNFPQVAEYVTTVFFAPHSDQWMTQEGKPLLCWYNGENMTGGINATGQKIGGWDNLPQIRGMDDFECRILGHNSYVNWIFCNPSTTPYLDLGLRGEWEPPRSGDGFVSVEPRYDDQFLGRTRNETNDPGLSEGLYDQQWTSAIDYAREGQASTVFIYSWNEFHERSQIEPCHDATAVSKANPYHLLNMTKQYIDQIRTKPLPLTVILVIAASVSVVALTVFLCWRRRRSRTPQ